MIPVGGEEDHPSSPTPPTPAPTIDDGTGIIPSEEVLRQAQERVKNAPPVLWGSYVRASTVTLLVGEASAGKTVLLYNLAYHIATGQEFLGFTPNRSLRVLSVDFEGNDEIRATNLNAIGTAPSWDLLIPPESLFELLPETRGQELIRRLEKAIRSRHYDIVIVDSLIEAYPVEEENSNDEANQQMVAFRRLAQSTTTGVILVHNAGLKQGNSRHKATNKGLSRGASARVDRADIVLNYTVEDMAIRALTVVKSRSSNLGEQIRVRFSGDLGYEVIESSAVSQSTIEKYQADSLRVVQEETKQGRPEVTRKTIMEQLQLTEGNGQAQALDRALARNVATDSLLKKRKGVYSLPLTPGEPAIGYENSGIAEAGSEREALVQNEALTHA
jgi:RecA-family ATPase